MAISLRSEARALAVMVAACAAGAGASRSAGQCAPEWDATIGQPGLSGGARTAIVGALGPGAAQLYVGGGFTTAGGVTVNSVAQWNGSAWSALGRGLTRSGGLSACNILAVYKGSLYAGGNFNEAGGAPAPFMARWDGLNWNAMDQSPNQAPIGMEVLRLGEFVDLYVGGAFTQVGTIAGTAGIARWDGITWAALGAGIDGSVNHMLVWDQPGGAPRLFVSGRFDTGSGQALASIAAWDGSKWAPVGGGLSGGAPTRGNRMALFDDGTGEQLYVIGAFTQAGAVAANNIARWNGSEWSAIGGGVDGVGTALVAADLGDGRKLYAGGSFATAGAAVVNYVARYDGESWTGIGSGLSGGVVTTGSAIAPAMEGGKPILYVAGGFAAAGGQPAGNVAKVVCKAAACAADCTRDGKLDVTDFACFQNAFALADLGKADVGGTGGCTPDGALSILDFACFQNLFALGCP